MTSPSAVATRQPNARPLGGGSSRQGEQLTRWAITTVLAIIALLTFTFSFGNVWALGLRLGVPGWISPLIGPAVDLSVTGLLVGVRYLALNGATAEQLREARLLLVFSGLVCLALNTAGPIADRAFGRAAFDAVGPLLLLGWAEVGPALLRHIHAITIITSASQQPIADASAAEPALVVKAEHGPTAHLATNANEAAALDSRSREPAIVGKRQGKRTIRISADLVAEARRIDREHRASHDRPASAATLRGHLHIGGPESNYLVKIVRHRIPDPSSTEANPQTAPVRTETAVQAQTEAGPAASQRSGRSPSRPGPAPRTGAGHRAPAPLGRPAVKAASAAPAATARLPRSRQKAPAGAGASTPM